MKEASDKRTNMIASHPKTPICQKVPRQAHFSHSEERIEPVSAQEPRTVKCIETKRTAVTRTPTKQLSISWTKAETSRDR